VPQGKVKWFSTEKAFGFIEQENDNDIFVHVTGLADGVTAIDKDMLVEYEVEQGRKGPQATNVRPTGGAAAAPAAEATETAEVVETAEVIEVIEVEDEAGDVVEEEIIVEVEEDAEVEVEEEVAVEVEEDAAVEVEEEAAAEEAAE